MNDQQSIDSITRSVADAAQTGDGFVQPIEAALPDSVSNAMEQIPLLQGQVKNLETAVALNQTIIWIVAIAVVVFVVCAMFLIKRLLKLQKETDARQDEKLKDLEKEVCLRVDNATHDMKTLKNQLDTLAEKAVKDELHVTQQSQSSVATPKITNKRTAQSKRNNLAESQVAPSNVKFFNPTESNGRLIVRERNLKDDDSRGWFSMEINGENATYDINPNAMQAILADTVTLGFCANQFDPNAKARTIRTISKGTLRKDGQMWVVVEKITVELV